MCSGFVYIRKNEWGLASSIGGARRQRLLGGIPFEEIIDSIARQARIVFHKRSRSKRRTGFYRVEMIMELDFQTVDLFHNSSCGYRAQYYGQMSIGETANRYAIQQIVHTLKNSSLKDNLKPTCPWPWVERSLLDSEAKVWIHQGPWARWKRIADRVMRVARWERHLHSSDSSKQRLALLGSLAPARESRIDVKGGFISLRGDPLGESFKPNRSWQIHELGYT
jgi:hypothetical protein